jgi:hypothetical protein
VTRYSRGALARRQGRSLRGLIRSYILRALLALGRTRATDRVGFRGRRRSEGGFAKAKSSLARRLYGGRSRFFSYFFFFFVATS